MKRVILAPAEFGGAALSELKQWLAVQTTAEDAALTGLLRSAADMCEAFTGAMALSATCEEILPAARDWQCLATRPVQAITGAEGINSASPGTVNVSGAETRFALPIDAYELHLAADGTGQVRILRQAANDRIAIRFTAGLAPGWGSLPEGLRHGIIRMAAHHYRERDTGDAASPPAAVAALWQPWRRARLV